MPQTKKELRDNARAAIAQAAPFEEFTDLKGFPKSIDSQSLPCFGVGTPRERREVDGLDSQDAKTDLVVVIKCDGGEDLEDVLDEHAEQLEALLIPALGGPREIEVTEISTSVDAAGDRRVGTMVMTMLAYRGLTLS